MKKKLKKAKSEFLDIVLVMGFLMFLIPFCCSSALLFIGPLFLMGFLGFIIIKFIPESNNKR